MSLSCARQVFFDDFSYFWLTSVSENKYTVWLVNYSHLRIVNKNYYL